MIAKRASYGIIVFGKQIQPYLYNLSKKGEGPRLTRVGLHFPAGILLKKSLLKFYAWRPF